MSHEYNKNPAAVGAIDIPSSTTHISTQVAYGVVIAEHFVSALASESVSADTSVGRDRYG